MKRPDEAPQPSAPQESDAVKRTKLELDDGAMRTVEKILQDGQKNESLAAATFVRTACMDAETALSLCNRAISDFEELYRFVAGRLPECAGELQEVTQLIAQVTRLGKRLHQQASRQQGRVESKPTPDQLSEYDVLTKIGTGTFGVTKLARHKPTGAYYCMKILSKQRIVKMKQQEHVRAERTILGMLHHPFLVSLVSSFQDEYNLYIVMDYVQGGELFAHIRASKTGLTQDVVRFYGAEILLALEYLHGFKIVHRDLKPENLLLDKRGHVKLVDFGFSKIVHDKTFTVCGTPEYIAGEIISGKGHGLAVDFWSFGVLMYEMLAGTPPFKGDTNYKLFEVILACQYSIPQHFSPEAASLINGLLQSDPTRRLGALKNGVRDVKEHAFFRDVPWAEILAAQRPGPLLHFPPGATPPTSAPAPQVAFDAFHV